LDFAGLGQSLITALLIIHALLSTGLLGVVTHQALAARSGSREGSGPLSARYRAADASVFTASVVVLFVVTTLMGAVLYPSYRLLVRPVLEVSDLRAANGAFEIKEHLAALGLLMLPAYWASWNMPESAALRRYLTWILAAIVWWNFLVGLVVTSLQGLFR
jgi:hypothetical protein